MKNTCKCLKTSKNDVKNDLRYFDISEFDSPDLVGSGDQMCCEFLQKIDEARHIANIPFVINSGFRTLEYHKDLGRRGYPTAVKSAHLKGCAADISCTRSTDRWKIINALLSVGFTRIGIAKTFIHVDCDETRTQNVIWKY